MMSNNPDQTSDHVPSDQSSDHPPKPITLSPPSSPAASTFDPNRTTGLDTVPTAAAEEVVPGYELLAEIGRGGMGVVYRARHIALNRIVALKMMLGTRTNDRELIRFLAEAEAVAAIRHPNVVQVHEYGNASGSPYMALEYLSGGTLSRWLSAAREPEAPEVVAEVVAKIARGVAAAHAGGIIHRDLKPGNVLFDEHGNPKVADFGLAKRIGGSELTETQAVMGTPAYMSPEQADGKTKFVGPQADVWALGVLLYELLTGERPFTADDVHGILVRILTSEPVPPRKLIPSLPRDLESITLKCLAKLPHERYSTAKELADDLDRFLRHEPISIRPAGVFERATKWVRRNKLLAGSSLAVAMALVVGSVVSLLFGLEARRQAKVATEETVRANAASIRAENAANDAIEKGKDLAKANEELQDTLAGALLGRVALPERNVARPLNFSEMHTFQEIASRRGTALPDHFVKHTTQTLVESRQLEAQAPFILHAAIGLDPAARDRADQMLFDAMNDRNLSLDQRAAIATGVAHWRNASPKTAALAARIVCDLMGSATNPFTQKTLAINVVLLVKRMEPTAAVRLLTELIARHPHPHILKELLPAMPDATKRVGRSAAADAAKAILDTMAKLRQSPDVNTSGTLVHLGEALASVAEQLEPTARIAACDAALKFIPAIKTPNVMPRDVTAVLVRLVAPLDAIVASQLLIDAMAKSTDPTVAGIIAPAFVPLAERLDPASVGPVAQVLTDTLGKPFGRVSKISDTLAQSLVSIAGRMDAATAAATALSVVDHMSKTADYIHLDRLKQVLRTMADRLNQAQVNELGKSTAEALGRTTDPTALNGYARGLAIIALRMDASEADAACRASAKHLMETLPKLVKSPSVVQLARGAAELAEVLKPDQARELDATAIKVLVDAVFEKPGQLAAIQWIEVVGFVAEDLDAATALSSAKAIIDAMAQTNDLPTLALGGQAVAFLCNRLKAKDAADMASLASKSLADALATTTNGNLWHHPARGLESLAKHMTPETASAVARVLTERIGQGQYLNPLESLTKALAATAARLDARTAAERCEFAAKVLSSYLAGLPNTNYAPSLIQGLSSVAGYLTPAAAAAATKAITDKVHRITHADRVTTNLNTVFVNELVNGLPPLARRMEPAAAAAMWNALSQLLTAELGKVLVEGEAEQLINSLGVVAVHLDAAGNAAIGRAVNAALAPGRTTGSREASVSGQAKGLTSIVSRLDSATASQSASAILGVMVSSWNFSQQDSRAGQYGYRAGFSACVYGVHPANARQRLFLSLGILGSQCGQPAGVSAVLLAQGAQPRPLPPQLLVELLKNPLCVAEYQRTVLDALELVYARRFADQWEFVQFVRASNLPLDLHSPPKRP